MATPQQRVSLPLFAEELWTSKQRQASSIHEVSYRACFKPQLPAYFIERLTKPGDIVYDPFSGRGTTAIEAALHGRRVISADVNPLSAILTQPRLEIPDLDAIENRFADIDLKRGVASNIDLSMFFHADTLGEIVALRSYLIERKTAGVEDAVDRWIRMVATNRLTGHSKGFFSVYSLPPNQAASAESQIKINRKLGQTPAYRDTRAVILRKSQQLQRNLSSSDRENLRAAAKSARLLTTAAHETSAIRGGSVQLTVTSPPFLDVVQYAHDNWLRCWFNDLDVGEIAGHLTMSRNVSEWSAEMARVFAELYRITKRGGSVAFEVGEVRKGKVKLEEHVVPLALDAGFACEALLINEQRFTKTAKIWGVGNNSGGTNTNRIVLLRKKQD
jgi:hypothetical protein